MQALNIISLFYNEQFYVENAWKSNKWFLYGIKCQMNV